MAAFDSRFAPYMAFGSRTLAPGSQGTDVVSGTFGAATRTAVTDIRGFVAVYPTPSGSSTGRYGPEVLGGTLVNCPWDSAGPGHPGAERGATPHRESLPLRLSSCPTEPLGSQ